MYGERMEGKWERKIKRDAALGYILKADYNKAKQLE